MPSANGRIERKYQLLEQLDPKHAAELDRSYTNHLAAAIQASSASERQQALNKAIEACENALDDVLYEILDNKHFAAEDENVS
jgi:hypothetical protein